MGVVGTAGAKVGVIGLIVCAFFFAGATEPPARARRKASFLVFISRYVVNDNVELFSFIVPLPTAAIRLRLAISDASLDDGIHFFSGIKGAGKVSIYVLRPI